MLISEMITLAVTIIVPLGAFIAWGWSRIDRKFDIVDRKLEAIERKIEAMETKFEKRFETNENDHKEIRTSLNRMEGAFYAKECCMLTEEKQSKKAS